MFTRIKDFVKNLLRHKIMVALILILGFISYQLFVRNYKFVRPIVSVHKETYNDVWNDRALCLTDKEAAENQLKEFNEEAIKELSNN